MLHVDDKWLAQLLAAEVIDRGVSRAATAGVAVWSGAQWHVRVGACGHTGRARATSRTRFDLASVSKPFLALAFARAVERGLLERSTRVSACLPELAEEPSGQATLEALLSHRAGLVPNLPLYAPLLERRALDRSSALKEIARALRQPESGQPIGEWSPVYSDLGYILAGAALASLAQRPLDELVEAEVTAPLGIGIRSARLWLKTDPEFVEQVAPTEHVPFRGGELRGVVHDENAWALAGHGFAGHAGLFGAVRDLLAFGMALLDVLAGRRSSWLSPQTLAMLLEERPHGSLRLGFDGKSDAGSAAGPGASARTFGHLGFTGTSLWCDPMAEAITVLLTNRVCPTRDNLGIRACRPRVHEALFRHAENSLLNGSHSTAEQDRSAGA